MVLHVHAPPRAVRTPRASTRSGNLRARRGVFPGTNADERTLIEFLGTLSRDDTLFHAARLNIITSERALGVFSAGSTLNHQSALFAAWNDLPDTITNSFSRVAAPGGSGRIALVVLGLALDVGTHQGPLAAGTHERDDLLHQRIISKLARDRVNSVGKYTIAKEQ
jgi:hypothetical protein